MQGYCHGALMQVNDRLGNRLPSLEEMLALRHESSGCRPLYPLVEYAYDIQLPDEVFDDPCIQELEDLGVDMVAMYALLPFNNTGVLLTNGLVVPMTFCRIKKNRSVKHCLLFSSPTEPQIDPR